MNLTVLFLSFSSGVNKTVLKTMSVMDLDKVNLELIEALLEWIVVANIHTPQVSHTEMNGGRFTEIVHL